MTVKLMKRIDMSEGSFHTIPVTYDIASRCRSAVCA